MPYTITLTDGTILTTVADTTVDNTSSLTLIGRNFSGYGGYIAEDFVHLLENFSYSTGPLNPLIGQLWYNTALAQLEIWSGSAWTTSPIRGAGITEVANVAALPAPSLAATSVYYVDTYSNGLPALASRLGSNWYYYPSYVPGYAVDIGTVNAMVAVITPAPATLAALLGVPINIKVANTSTSAVTLNLNSFGVTPITSNGHALRPNMLLGGEIITVIYDGTNFQMISSANGTGPGLTTITGPLTIYVATTGNDSTGNGTFLNPYATIQAAWYAIISAYNCNNQAVTIQVANGTYNGVVSLDYMPVGCQGISIIGNPTSPSLCVLSISVESNTFNVSFGANITLSGFTIQSNVSISIGYANGIIVAYGGNLLINNCILSAINGWCIISTVGGYVTIGSGNSLANNLTCAGFLLAEWNGFIGTAPTTGAVNFGSGITFASSVALAQFGGNMELAYWSATGSGPTGCKYVVQLNGNITTNGAGPNFLPGSVAGIISTGGNYV